MVKHLVSDRPGNCLDKSFLAYLPESWWKTALWYIVVILRRRVRPYDAILSSSWIVVNSNLTSMSQEQMAASEQLKVRDGERENVCAVNIHLRL